VSKGRGGQPVWGRRREDGGSSCGFFNGVVKKGGFEFPGIENVTPRPERGWGGDDLSPREDLEIDIQKKIRER